MNKRLIIGLALITLIIFPIPAMVVRFYIDGITPLQLLDLKSFSWEKITLGLEFGIGYALFSIIMLRLPFFERIPMRIEKVIKTMNLTIAEGIFISFCAGFGEELLFRSGAQSFLGIPFTSILFIAVHGYFSVTKPLNSLYGVLLLPFILGISYGFEWLGLWFAIAAHFAYDAVIFTSIIRDEHISAE